MIVDVHAHAYPEEYFDFIGRFGPKGAMRPDDIKQRFAHMDEAGVRRQVLSPTQPPYLEDPDHAAHAARLVNNAFADMADAHGDRLSYFASLPMPHVELALEELARAMDTRGAAGVALHCFCRGESIAQAAFEPLFAELNRRRAVVFLHPVQNGLGSALIKDFGLTVCAGASFEDAVAAMHLIARQVPVRYPHIRFIIPHFGGPLAMLLNRLDGQMPKAGLTEPPSVTARRMYYDTVGWGSKAALLAAVEAYGADRLVTGSDYPILVPWEGYRQTFDHIVEAGLPAHTSQCILGAAARLLGFDKC